MSKHTPKPWLIAGEDSTFVYALNNEGSNRFFFNVGGGWADGRRNFRTTSDELEANARLIAAAPELLDALEACLERLKQYAEDDVYAGLNGYGCSTNPEEFIKPWVSMAENAIAKAKGGS